MDRENVLSRYNELKKKVIKRKEQFDRLMSFLEGKTDWLRSPASTRFHLSEEMGLLAHSVNVAETLLLLKGLLAPEISDESCVITGLLHDLGKAGVPGKPQYIPNEPSEKQKMYQYKPNYPYRFNKDLVYLSVPVRSLYIISRFVDLTETEAQAIVYHDGQYVDDNRSVANNEEPLTLLLQYADNWSGFVLEKKEEGKD